MKYPELIPDSTAYSLFLRFLSGRQTDAEKNRARSYIRMWDIGNPDALFALAAEYERRVAIFDRQALEIRECNRHNLDLEARGQLNKLQKQKDALVAEMVASLTARLGAGGAEKLKRHVNEHVKRKVKINPPRNPTGEAQSAITPLNASLAGGSRSD